MPKIINAERKKQLPPVRVSEEELSKIQGKAEELKLSLSDYIRLVTLNAEINIKIR